MQLLLFLLTAVRQLVMVKSAFQKYTRLKFLHFNWTCNLEDVRPLVYAEPMKRLRLVAKSLQGQATSSGLLPTRLCI